MQRILQNNAVNRTVSWYGGGGGGVLNWFFYVDGDVTLQQSVFSTLRKRQIAAEGMVFFF